MNCAHGGCSQVAHGLSPVQLTFMAQIEHVGESSMKQLIAAVRLEIADSLSERAKRLEVPLGAKMVKSSESSVVQPKSFQLIQQAESVTFHSRIPLLE
jgi:hypothetical protein